jgi:hypothetical protein
MEEEEEEEVKERRIALYNARAVQSLLEEMKE